MNCLATEYLDAIVKKYPDKIAFIDPKRKVTFLQLQEEAFSIAKKLIEYNYFKQPVLIFMEKSVSLISTFLGSAYSGNFYSPLDTNMPAERINKIIETLEPVVIITDERHKEQVAQFSNNKPVWIFEEMVAEKVGDREDIYKISNKIIDTDILYVLFTSGSTGIPKGVIINHKAAVDFVDWICNCYSFDETTVFANQAQLYFDLSIQDVYAPLKAGCTTVLIPNRMYTAPVRVWKTILEHQVNTLVWIPSMLSLFANLDILRNVERAPLKTVLFCGEVMPMKQLNYWIRNYPEVTFGNLYGPTECTEACAYYNVDREFSDEDVLPMGKACENSEIMLINEEGNVVTKTGEIGELCVRGTCLSSGYYADEMKTKEVFVQNPLNKKFPELIYKTGDLCCYNEREELVYISRKDFQIKIRGYRVELGEIEAAVAAVENVTYNCCLFDKSKEKLILVYTGGIEVEQLDAKLREKLQEYMIPTEYHHRDEMLFNINGKVDRKALGQLYISDGK